MAASNSKLKIVIAGTYAQFLNYCHEQELNPKDHNVVRYVSDPYHIRGLRNCEVIYTGNYMRNPVYGDPYLRFITLEK